MRKARTVALVAGTGALLAALAAGTGTAAPTAQLAQAAQSATAGHSASATPQIILQPGTRQLPQAKALRTPWTTALCESDLKIACYQPDQIQAAYDETPLFNNGITGQGETIVIVDVYGSPTIKSDLATFDSQFGFPDPPSFNVITPVGRIPAWNPRNADMTGWASETTLDVEYAHTMAPGASILLVETPTAETEGANGFPQMIKAEEYVIDRHLGDVITQSFDATEATFLSYRQLAPLRAAYQDAYRHGITVLAASGDDGASGPGRDLTTLYTKPVTGWPATDPLVTAVGGTQLKENAAGSFSSVVWNDTYNVGTQRAFTGAGAPSPLSTGGGVSEFFARPSYQNSVARVTGTHRGIPDISLSGACNGAVTIYSTYPGDPAGWGLVCGTSESSPLFSGIVALADQVAGHPLGLINPTLYALSAAHAPGLVDVTQGNNTVSFVQGSRGTRYSVKGYSARPGYDLASGVGTVDAASLVPELAQG
jgi:subtilase family serine protease